MNTENAEATTQATTEAAPAVTMKADELSAMVEAAVERGVKRALEASKPGRLETAWLRSFGKHFRAVPGGSLNGVEMEALRSFGGQVGDEAEAVELIEFTLANWEEAATVIKRDTNALIRPSVSVYALADNVSIIKRWATMRGFLTGVPEIREHKRIGKPLPAVPYQNRTAKGIA